MTNLELWNSLALGMTSLVALGLFYLWTAIALAAVFRKSGEAGWKAWVPVLNLVVLLQIAGLSGWLVLLFLIPVVGFVLLIVAAYRVNVAFGRGAGMTVLAALLFPAWATVLGFGPDRWIGREGIGRGPMRTPAPEQAPAAPARSGSAEDRSAPRPAYAPIAPPPAYGRAAASGPQPAGWTPPPLPGQPAPGAGSPVRAAAADAPVPPTPPAPAPAVAQAAPVDEIPAALRPVPGDAGAPRGAEAPAGSRRAAAPEAEPVADPQTESEVQPEAEPDLPAPARSAFAGPAPAPVWADDEIPPRPPLPDEPVSSLPRRTGTPVAPPAWELEERADTESWDFDFGPASATSEVTDAVTGAPAPVSAAPVRAVPPAEPPAPKAEEPPVTRVPAAPAPAAMREPWAPAPSPVPAEGEAFPESSGPVSAIAGAPDAGGPRSARSSVSAMHTRPHIPEEDEIEATIVARRKRTAWTLVGPSGARVPLTSDTVILGRRPAADPRHPDAQLVSLDDDTRTISKTHALLELRDDHWFITDLDSTNGVLFTTLLGTEVAATPGEATEAGESFLLGDAEVSLSRSDA